MPSLGTSVPAPSVLAVANCPVQLQVHKSKGCKSDDDVPQLKLSSHLGPGKASSTPGQSLVNAGGHQLDSRAVSPEETSSFSQTTFLSISDDGRLWHWVMTAELPLAAKAQRLSVGTSLGTAESTYVVEETRQDVSGLLTSDPVFKV